MAETLTVGQLKEYIDTYLSRGGCEDDQVFIRAVQSKSILQEATVKYFPLDTVKKVSTNFLCGEPDHNYLSLEFLE